MKSFLLPAFLFLFLFSGSAMCQESKPAAGASPNEAPKAKPGGAPKAKGNAKGEGKANAPGKSKAPGKAKGKAAPPVVVTALSGPVLSSQDKTLQRDFPAMALDPEGTMWITYVEHDGTADTVRLAKKSDGAIVEVAVISDPGVIHQPALAVDRDGEVWTVWGQTGADDVVHLMARALTKEGPGEILTLADSTGSDSFANAGTDAAGRVWVTWQSMRAGEGDVFTRYYDPATAEWSGEIAVATLPGGDWEPAIAFAGEDRAWIVYDSSRGNEFNLYLAEVTLDGKVETYPVAHSDRYEARACLSPTADGEGLWIAAERGRVRWGLDLRGHQQSNGLNAQKEILFGRFDIASKTFIEHPPGPAGAAGNPVNLPSVGLDAAGMPWLSYRYFNVNRWEIAVTRFDPVKGIWHARKRLPDSSMGQDRQSSFLHDGDGALWHLWPSDLRTDKTCFVAGIYLAKFDLSRPFEPATPPGAPADLSGESFSPSQATPERPADELHQWQHDGETYTLLWGDVHRHTDVSNCRTGFEGCIVEQFRYAYDMAKLDFLGTSDHTDIAKIYDPYEWWHNQRLADVFHSPGKFTSLYVYEREQRWPWGHRNVVFAQRGGPIVYINRTTYRNSPWQKLYSVEANPAAKEIDPPELWRILREYGEPVAIVSHTGATGMGTDWGRYDEATFDHSLENVVEIFQGARVSYEGKGTPQPLAGLRPGESYTADSGGTPPAPPAAIEDFGTFTPGVYQNALEMGLRLGVFASSDHISTHVSYGGVYVKEVSRLGIIEALKARRTVAATDKIYLEFTCNGSLLGSIFEVEGVPEFHLSVNGTAPVKRVTLLRNEKDFQVWEGTKGNVFEVDFTDEAPVREGESRYYVRVEQSDGNMAWSSPVWVTVKP